jgi:hypothetical protein
MKIFFTCSQSGRNYVEDYRLVMRLIKENRNKPELIATEDLSYLKLAEELKKDNKNVKYLHAETVRRALYEADGVVIDASQPGFRLGHEATLAMLKNKPVLVLSQSQDYSDLMDFKNFYASKYNPKDLSQLQYIIDNFLEKVKAESLAVRFNMFISDGDKAYLEKKAKEKEITMSEYVRFLIKADREPN